MNVRKAFKIVGTGAYLPLNKVASKTLENKYNIPAGWSEKNSGVVERFHAEHISGGEMGADAVENALQNANLALKDIDLLISTSATFDYPLPNQAVSIKAAIKGSEAYDFPVLSVNSTCTGFISGLEIAANLLDGQQYRTIVIVSAEISSKGINPDNWETISLFGDAAVAAVITYDPSGKSGLIKAAARTYSEGAHQAIIKGGGNAYPIKDHAYDKILHSFNMSGFSLLKLAKKYIPQFMGSFFSELPIGILDADYILPHQASKTGLAVFKNLFPFKEGQVLENLSKNGNCISASIPLLLHESLVSGNIKNGNSCLLCGTSAGFSIAGALIKI